SGDSTSTTGPRRSSPELTSSNVRAKHRRSAEQIGAANLARSDASASVSRDSEPVRQRSRKPQQPKRSRNTSDATSLTSYLESKSCQTKLRSRCPPVLALSSATSASRPVQRLT